MTSLPAFATLARVPSARRSVLSTLALATALAAAAPVEAARPTAVERAVVRVVNDARAARSIAPVRFAWPLQARSHRYAAYLRRTGRFEHAGGLPPRTRENLAWATANVASAHAIIRIWLRSPSHRANLLWPSARRIGLGVARGPYRGYRDVRVAVARLRP